MKETMTYFNSTGKTKYTENNFNILKYLHKYDYHPQSVFSFSPYKEDEEVYDIISATKGKRGKIDCISPIVRIPLDEAERLFKTSLNDIISNGTTGKIYLLNVPTAIGKTEMLTNLNGVIAAPTNELKNEIGNRMKVNYLKTPDPVIFSDNNINNKIDYYYRIGDHQNAIAVMHDIAKSGNPKYTTEDVEKATNYINQVDATYHSTETILTTHIRAIHSHFDHDTIIFDEDPLKSILEVKQMDLTDLKKIQYQVGDNKELNHIIEYLENTPKIVVTNTPEFSIDINDFIDNISIASVQSNIFEFFGSKFFVRDGNKPHIIHYVKMNPLPKDKKIIILSATLPIFIYEKLFGDQLEVINIQDVDHVGTIKQYTKRSCSRNALKYYIKELSDEIGDKRVLTFKSYGNQFTNPIKEMYFGNCSGYDTMNGKDLVVVGTPHRNPIEYMLIAKFLGIDFTTTDLKLDDRYVEYNGFRFMFKSYQNEGLRMIQLALIESELIQAVGRARTLRTNATVEVYSSLPLRISNEFVY
jgi:energy-coupling factor transporter ATP-binding protein EcfA2